MKISQGRERWTDLLTCFRSGDLILEKNGLVLSGTAIAPHYIQGLIYLFAFCVREPDYFTWGLTKFVGLWLMVEYGTRHKSTEWILWKDVDKILVEPATDRVCVIYSVSSNLGKKCALGLRMTGNDRKVFLENIPIDTRRGVIETKIGEAFPVWFRVFFVGSIAAFIAFSYWLYYS